MIFPGYEVIAALKDYEESSDDFRRLLHLETLTGELLRNIREVVVKNGLNSDRLGKETNRSEQKD